jgi:hypothetical protein
VNTRTHLVDLLLGAGLEVRVVVARPVLELLLLHDEHVCAHAVQEILRGVSVCRGGGCVCVCDMGLGLEWECLIHIHTNTDKPTHTYKPFIHTNTYPLILFIYICVCTHLGVADDQQDLWVGGQVVL